MKLSRGILQHLFLAAVETFIEDRGQQLYLTISRIYQTTQESYRVFN